eukprot:11705160-Ditylum_brightwellii.AAC.1
MQCHQKHIEVMGYDCANTSMLAILHKWDGKQWWALLFQTTSKTMESSYNKSEDDHMNKVWVKVKRHKRNDPETIY